MCGSNIPARDILLSAVTTRRAGIFLHWFSLASPALTPLPLPLSLLPFPRFSLHFCFLLLQILLSPRLDVCNWFHPQIKAASKNIPLFSVPISSSLNTISAALTPPRSAASFFPTQTTLDLPRYEGHHSPPRPPLIVNSASALTTTRHHLRWSRRNNLHHSYSKSFHPIHPSFPHHVSGWRVSLCRPVYLRLQLGDIDFAQSRIFLKYIH